MKVAVGDVQQIFLALLALLLRKAGHDVVWEGRDVLTAVREADKRGADICLLGVAGRSPTALLDIPSASSTPVVLLLPRGESGLVAHAQLLPVSGLAMRDDGVHEIVAVATECLHRRRCCITGVVLSPRAAALARSTPDAFEAPLTARELQILGMLAAGATTSDLSRELDLKVSTIRTHVGSILQKLRVHSRVEAVTVARQRAILSGQALL